MRLNLDRTGLVEPFRVLTVTLLSLLVPLSFLLLSRLSCAHYAPYPAPNTTNLLHVLQTLLHVLVSVICVATLVHALTGRFAATAAGSAVKRIGQLRLLGAWVYLCALQVCVGLGIEGSLAAGIDGSDVLAGARGATLLSRVVFFVGMHEATSYWAGEAVGPVVDDTVFGEGRPGGWAQRVGLAVGCGALWWWRLREEVGAMVLVARIEPAGAADFVGWWLYYLTVTIGMVKVVKTVMWVGMVLLCKRVRVRGSNGNINHDRGNSNSNNSSSTVIIITEEQLQQACDWEEKV